ncbi:Subtilisin-like protease [Actinidia chinensis var. chinensis]|uniref:Subtilisin-like protease n=1 Tax=Actinidia chinensis var. chinensis TaxID=1590841 RepID=A0A2R6Q060_ACTCC|nr:Subtilisin-like protease [Actinidia chinensis var. chinensis]
MGSFIDLPIVYSTLITWLMFTHLVSSTAVERSTYIVHVDKSVMPRAFTSHHHWYSSMVDTLTQSGPTTSDVSHSKPSLVYSYDNVVHGFCALLSQAELEAVKNTLGFVSAYSDRQLKLRTTHTPEFLSLNPSTGLWPVSDYGRDVIIGVIDTGVWPESPSFREDGMTSSPIPAKWKGMCEVGQDFNASMCNSKLIGARYFNKALKANNPNLTFTMDSARDSFGHGTHTSSTAAGNYVDHASFFGYAEGTARGIAPRARVAMYKVIWGEGFQSSDFLAGIDQAVADGVDVLSLSIGFDEDLPFYENPIAISTFGAMEKGIVVSHAGGNTGPGFLSLFDSIPWSVTVAAGSIDRFFTGTLSLGNGFTVTGWTLFPASALVEKLPLYYNKTVASCDSTELLSEQVPFRNIIICENTGSFFSQLEAISRSNVAAAVFISDDPLLSVDEQFPWPGVVISPNDGQAVIQYAKTGDEPWASMKFKKTILGTKPAPAVEYYSSRGPSRTYTRILKPDLMAPGSLVLAAWPPNLIASKIGSSIPLLSDYTLLSGTSMACPHIAGVAALLKASHPNWSAAAIRSAMMTTANPFDNSNHPIQDKGRNNTFASPLAVGSGQIDPNPALDPGLVYDLTPQDYVNVLCYMNYTKNQILTVTRSKLYHCSNPSPDLNYPSFIMLYSNESIAVQTFQRTLTNVGGDAATYNAEVVAPAGSKVTISPNMLVFSKKFEKKSYTLNIEYKAEGNETNTYGSIVWVEDSGKHRVRSPIVLSPEVMITR